MSVRDTLADMAALATRLEAEGAEIIAAGVDNVADPKLHLWDESLPDAVRERGEMYSRCGGYTMYGYVEGGIRIFWMKE